MSSRTPLRAALPLLLLPAAASTSFGFAEIARGSLLLQTSASATYDSYFLGTVDNAPDTIYTLYPSLRFNRNAGRGTISASTGVAFNRHEKNKDLDSDDIRANAAVQLPTAPGARLDGNVSVEYNEATIVDLYVNDRVATRTFGGNLGFDYRLTDRIDLTESLRYTKSLRELYSDQELFSNEISMTYAGFLRGTSLVVSHGLTLTNTSADDFTGGEGLDQQSNTVSIGLSRPLYGDVTGSLSYGYTILTRSANETSDGNTRSDSSSITATINGPFLPRNRFPKLTSSASLMYSQSATAGLNDNGGKFLSGHLSLAWSARERTKLNIHASRTMDLSVTNLSRENTRIGGGFDQQIGYSTSLSGNAGYTWSSTRGSDRSDQVIDAGLSLSRSFNKYLSVGTSYTYENNDTSATGVQPGRYAPRDYERHTGTVNVTVTF